MVVLLVMFSSAAWQQIMFSFSCTPQTKQSLRSRYTVVQYVKRFVLENKVFLILQIIAINVEHQSRSSMQLQIQDRET